MGAKHVDIFIPHREIDGYGLNLKTVEEFFKTKGRANYYLRLWD